MVKKSENSNSPELGDELGRLAERVAGKKNLPPVDDWNPSCCRALDIKIAADGTWYYMNSPIERRRLVGLFSTILRKDSDGIYYLVTPVEKVAIEVEDAPFLAIEMSVTGKAQRQSIQFRTNVDDVVVVSESNPMRFEFDSRTNGVKPYILVRGRLEALLTRAITFDLIELGQSEIIEGTEWFGVWSAGDFFPMAPASTLEEAV